MAIDLTQLLGKGAPAGPGAMPQGEDSGMDMQGCMKKISEMYIMIEEIHQKVVGGEPAPDEQDQVQ